MIYNARQLKIFKDVKKRTWYAQNRLRESYRKQFRNVLKNFFNTLASGVKISYGNRSLIELDIEIRKQQEQLKRIFRVQYMIIATAFRDNALGRFFSAKDLALIESLEKDGFKIPKDLKYREIAKKYDIPSGLLELAKNNQAAFLTLKIVEIIGEDEVYNLDAETIYFISHLLNETKLKSFRNEILISGLPLRS